MNTAKKNKHYYRSPYLIQYVTLFATLVNLAFISYLFLTEATENNGFQIISSVNKNTAVSKNEGIQQKITPVLSIETITLIESLKPKTTINIKKQINRKKDILYIGFWVENIGAHELIVSTKHLKLSVSPFGDDDNDKANVKVLYSNPPSVILPKEKQEHQFRIDISGYSEKSLHYSLQMESIPNPTIEKIVRKLTSGLGIQIPDTFFILKSTRVGAISL